MKHKHKPAGPVAKVEYELEKDVIETMKAMEAHTKIPASELVNTAVKRFIAGHKDYLPEGFRL